MGLVYFKQYCACELGQQMKRAYQRGREDKIRLLRQAEISTLFGEARIPSHFAAYTFETYPRRGAQIALDRSRDYAKSDSRRGLVLLGGYGTGKTGLAVCILREKIEQGMSSLFVQVPDLLDRIRAAYGREDRGAQDVLEQARKVDFLVLDDFGTEKRTPWVNEKLYQIIGYRHDWKLPTVITTDRSLDQLRGDANLSGERQADRVVWRIVEMCDVVEVAGPNLRDQTEGS